MKTILLILLSTITIFAQSQKCENDTLVNRIEFLKMRQIIEDCNDAQMGAITQIKTMEISIDVYKKRIKFLEDLLINREKFNIKKCPKFKKKKRRSQKFT
jgi:hypothetical protein